MLKLIAILMAVPAIGIGLGIALSRSGHELGRGLVVLCLVVTAVAIFSAHLATIHPGPESQYLDNPDARFLRDAVVQPLLLVWPLLSILLLATLAYFLHRRACPSDRNGHFLVALKSFIAGVFFLPPIAVGLSIHAAHHAGAWL